MISTAAVKLIFSTHERVVQIERRRPKLVPYIEQQDIDTSLNLVIPNLVQKKCDCFNQAEVVNLF